MVEFDRDSQCRPRTRALVLAALGLAVAGAGGAACVTNPYYVAPEGTESSTDPSGDASTSADPTDTTDGTTEVTTGDPGTLTDATSTTGLSTTEPLTSGSSSTTNPDESESEGDCQAIKEIEITIDEDAFFIDSAAMACYFMPWAHSELRCGYLNFGSTEKAPIANIDQIFNLRSTLALRPNIDELKDSIDEGELLEAWIEITVDGAPKPMTTLEVRAIHPDNKWYAGKKQGEDPKGALESTYRNLHGQLPWFGGDGPTGESMPICKVDLESKLYQAETLTLCQSDLSDYLVKEADDHGLSQGLVIFTNTSGGGGKEFYTYASEAEDSELRPKMFVTVCMQ